MPGFALVPAAQVDPAQLHAAFTAAFADYLIGPFQLAPDQWPQFLARQGVDLALSQVALAQGAPVAFCLASPRPDCDSWRLGSMGALAAARGSGAAPALLDDFIARARAAGAAAVELECFAQNTRALRLYQSRGFGTVDALHGYQHAAGAPAAAIGNPLEVDLQDAFAWLDACGAAGCPLPLQVTPRSLRALPALRAWRLGDAQAVVSAGADGRIQVHSLVDRRPAQHNAQALVGALLARHPESAFHVPQLQRHAVGGAALERLGFERLPLHQLWLRLDF